MATLQVTPAVLEWARNTSALSAEDAAKHVNVRVERLLMWESGEQEPPVTTAKALAHLYGRPLATFFLPEPPLGRTLPADYRLRTIGGVEAVQSAQLFKEVRRVMAWQQDATTLAEKDPELFPSLVLPRFPVGTDSEDAAISLRNWLSVDEDFQIRWPDAEQALAAWRTRVEGKGILVFFLGMDRRVCRGFSVLREGLIPAIGLARESSQARLFTLLHELAHLTLRTEAICLQFENSTGRGQIEAWCNRVAAALLLPPEILDSTPGLYAAANDSAATYETLRPFARELNLSVPALALRLQYLGMAPRTLYNQILTEDFQRALDRPPSDSGGGGANSWPGVRISERGEAFSSAVFRAWESGLLSSGDAARVMNMQVTYVSRLGRSLERRRERRSF